MKLKIKRDEPKLSAMYYLLLVIAFISGFLLIVLSPVVTNADTTVTAAVRFNNDNLLTTPQPKPIGMEWEFGSTTIIALEGGYTLIAERYILDPEQGVSISRYSIDDAWWYVTNKGVIYGTEATTGLQALSIYLTM